MRVSLATCAALLAAVLAAAQEPAAPPPVVRSIEVHGATAYDLKSIQRILRVEPGDHLRRPPEALAETLERRYHIVGFPAARVEARFDADTGSLSLFVDEGRLASVEVDGVEGSSRRRVLEVLDLRPGRPVKERDISGALSRLEKLSGGAYVSTADPPYTIEPGPDGVKLTLHLRRKAARLQIGPGGAASAAVYDRVDGLNLSASARLTLYEPVSFDHAEAYGQIAYGFSSHTARYAVGALKPFGPDRQFVLGYEYHDFTDTDDTFRKRTVEDLPGSIVYFRIFEDYYRRQGHQAYAFARLASRFQIGALWRSDDYRSLPVVADDFLLFNDKRTPNPLVTEGRMRSIVGVARWAWKSDLFDRWPDERRSLLVRDPYASLFLREQRARVDTSLEVSSPGLGGDFDFRRFIAQARAAQVFSPRHALLLRTLVGVGWGEVPPQRKFFLGGLGTLRGYPLKQFEGDHAVVATAEYWWYPSSPWPGVTLFYDGGTAWDRGLPGPGWKHNLGAGVEWPGGGRGYVRVDLGIPLTREPGNHWAYVNGFFRIPF